jgi:heme A synthase
MYPDIKELHSYWAYGVLIFLLLAVLNSAVGLSRKKPFGKNDRTIALIALIFTHVQFLLGMIMYFLSPYLDAAKAGGMGAAMKDSTLRLYLVEHPLVNIIAIVLITIGWSKHKKAETSEAKFKKIAIMYAIGLVLLLSRIPWSAWLS